MEEKKMNENIKIAIPFVILALLIATLGCFEIVDTGHRGVKLTFGKASDLAIGEGLNFKIPLVQTILEMNVQTQKYVAKASAASKDLQIVSTEIAVNYHLIPDSAPTVYREIGLNFEDRVIQPAVQEVVKAVTAQFTAEELITKRAEAKDKIGLELQERISKRSIAVEEISITDFEFSESFNSAIEAKVEAEQLKLKAERDLQRIEIEAQQKIEQAKAEAESIRIQSEALKENPDILQLRAIEKWNGVLPLVTGGDQSNLIDVNGLMGAE